MSGEVMTQDEILKIVSENPGITQSEVTTKYAPNSAVYRALLRDKLIRRERYGQTFKLYSVK